VVAAAAGNPAGRQNRTQAMNADSLRAARVTI
jgi:hypothetical protein